MGPLVLMPAPMVSTRGTRGRTGIAAAAAGLWLVLLAGPAHAVAELAGYRTEEVRTLAPGVEYRRVVRPDGPVVVHVVALRRDAGHVLRSVLSDDRVAGSAPTQERTSAMCRRVRCIAAVNGDFAFPTGQPVGGVVAGGRMLRSPVPTQHQLSVTPAGGLEAGTLAWSAQLVPSDLRPVAIHGLNVDRPADTLVLYTPAYGLTTATNQFGAELVLRVVEPTGGPRVGHTALVELAGFLAGGGDSAIPPDGLILSGHGAGAAALADLWGRRENGVVGGRALLRVETAPQASESVGGTPVLVHEARRWVADDGSSFVAGRHPRTVVGWNDSEVLLVAVDGRQPGYSAGMTLPEAADLLLALGATEALNLDGGGSTTLAVGPSVVNRPSDRMVRRGGRELIVHELRPGDVLVGSVERPVASGLAIVPAGPLATSPADPFAAGDSLLLPDAEAPPYDSDPASVPGAGTLALLNVRPPSSPTSGLVAVAAGIEVAVAQWLVIVAVARRRALR